MLARISRKMISKVHEPVVELFQHISAFVRNDEIHATAKPIFLNGLLDFSPLEKVSLNRIHIARSHT